MHAYVHSRLCVYVCVCIKTPVSLVHWCLKFQLKDLFPSFCLRYHYLRENNTLGFINNWHLREISPSDSDGEKVLMGGKGEENENTESQWEQSTRERWSQKGMGLAPSLLRVRGPNLPAGRWR